MRAADAPAPKALGDRFTPMPRRARRPFPRARLVLFLVAALLPLGLAPQALGKKKPAAAPPVVLSEHEALERIVGAGLSSDEPYQALADL